MEDDVNEVTDLGTIVVNATNSGQSGLKAGEATKNQVTGTIVNRMKYPSSDQDDYRGTIEFQTYSHHGADGDFVLSNAKKLANTARSEYNKLSASTSTENTGKEGFIKKCGNMQSGKGTSGLEGIIIPKPTGDAVELYLPPSLQFASSSNYGPVDLGTTGAMIERGINQGGNLLNSAFNAIITEGKSLIDGLLNEAKGEKGQLAIAKLARGLTDNLEGGVKSAIQTAVNPNTRLLFNNVGLRSFSFQFKLIPTDKDEAIEIEKIIKFFRKEQHPKSISPEVLGGIRAGFKFPNKFKIIMRHGDTILEPKIDYCYLESVNVVYNSTSMGMHSDGKFTEYDLSLTFREERALDKQKIEEGY